MTNIAWSESDRIKKGLTFVGPFARLCARRGKKFATVKAANDYLKAQTVDYVCSVAVECSSNAQDTVLFFDDREASASVAGKLATHEDRVSARLKGRCIAQKAFEEAEEVVSQLDRLQAAQSPKSRSSKSRMSKQAAFDSSAEISRLYRRLRNLHRDFTDNVIHFYSFAITSSDFDLSRGNAPILDSFPPGTAVFVEQPASLPRPSSCSSDSTAFDASWRNANANLLSSRAPIKLVKSVDESDFSSCRYSDAQIFLGFATADSSVAITFDSDFLILRRSTSFRYILRQPKRRYVNRSSEKWELCDKKLLESQAEWPETEGRAQQWAMIAGQDVTGGKGIAQLGVTRLEPLMDMISSVSSDLAF